MMGQYDLILEIIITQVLLLFLIKIVWVNDENKSYMSHPPNGISKLLQIIFNLSHILILCLLLLLV